MCIAKSVLARLTAARLTPPRLIPKALLFLVVALSLQVFVPRHALAQSTAFTFQGRLQDGGALATGTVDMRFALFDAPSGGAQIGPLIGVSDVLVNTGPSDDGLVQVELDFGVSAFVANAPRWLEVSVARDGGASVTLSPRTPLTAAPFSLNTRGVYVDAQNNVGIKTAEPDYTLDVLGTFHAGGVLIKDAQNQVSNLTRTLTPTWQSFTPLNSGELRRITFHMGHTAAWNGTLTVHEGEGTAGPIIASRSVSGAAGPIVANVVDIPPGVLVNADSTYTFAITTPPEALFFQATSNPYAGGRAGSGVSIDMVFSIVIAPTGLVVNDAGRVGIGTTNPAAELDVRGSIKLGQDGELSAPGADEELRIVRGNVSANGQPAAGSGFNSSGLVPGTYLVVFTRPFSGEPTVTVSPGSQILYSVDGVTTTGFQVRVVTIQGFTALTSFGFVAIGPR